MNLLFLNFSLTTGMVWGLVIGAIIFLPIIFLFVCYYILAPKNIFFTFGRENRVMHVMNGKKFSGKVILPSQTLYVDKKTYEIKRFEDLPVDYPESEKKKLRQKSFFGMHWIGIPPFFSINERHQQWLEWESTETGRKIRFRDEMTPFLIATPFEYAMLLKEGEDKNGVPLNVYFTVILKPINARLPIFGNENAYGQVQTLCLGEALLFVKEKTFSSLGGENTDDLTEISDKFSTAISKINDKIPGRQEEHKLGEVLGYKILDAKLDSVEITGDLKEQLLEASTAEYIALEKAKATIATADGALGATKLEAQGKKAIFDVQTEYYKNISSVPGAMKVEERKATPGITTLTEVNGKKKPGLLIGGGK